jgi:cellulose synthase operon protein C
MNWNRLFVLLLPLVPVGCQSGIDNRGTIAQLRNMKIEIQEEQLEGGLEKAIESYQRFLAETPDSALTPEAIRRLADLKVEREYGHLTGGGVTAGPGAGQCCRPRNARRDLKPFRRYGQCANDQASAIFRGG